MQTFYKIMLGSTILFFLFFITQSIKADYVVGYAGPGWYITYNTNIFYNTTGGPIYLYGPYNETECNSQLAQHQYTSPCTYYATAPNYETQDTTPPVVTLISPTPAEGATLPVNQEVVLQATATDNIGVEEVKFYVSGTTNPVGVDHYPPYTAENWTPTVAGNYAITAKGTDLAGNTTTTPARNIVVGTGGSEPSVTLTGFVDGNTFPLGQGIFILSVPSNIPSAAIVFYQNNTPIETDMSAPYSITWTPATAGTYEIKAIASNATGITATSPTLTAIVGDGGNGNTPIPPTTLGDNVTIDNIIITVSGGTATITGDVTPANTTTLTLALFSDNTYTTPVGGTHPISLTNGSFSIPLTGLSDGTYFFTISDTSQGGTNGNTNGLSISHGGITLANITHSVNNQGDVSFSGKFAPPTHADLGSGVNISLLDSITQNVVYGPSVVIVNPVSGTFSEMLFGLTPNGTYRYNLIPQLNSNLVFSDPSMIFTVGNGITSSNSSYTFTISGQGTNTNTDDDDDTDPNGNSLSLNNFFSGLGVSIPSNCVNRRAEDAANQNGEQQDGEQQWYCFLAPLLSSDPEINTSASANDQTPIIPKVVNMFFKIGIAILIVLSVLMFAYNAFQYMLSPGVFDKKAATTGMWNAVLGLVIGLSIYLILSIINTNLLNLDIDVPQNDIDTIHQDAIANELMTADQFMAVTGVAPKTPAEINTIITSVIATKFPAPATDDDRAKQVCAIKSIIQKENSSFNSGAIGHDEDVGLPGGPGTDSTKAFIASTKKYSSDTAFTTTPPKNDDHGHSGNPVENTAGLGLDWRFSHGIGLMQVTFFPDAYDNSDYKTNPPPWSSRNTLPDSIDGHSPKEMLIETNNISSGVDIYEGFLTSDDCGENSNSANIWLKTFSGYNGGWDACDEQTGTPYGQSVYATFQACVAAL